MIKIKWSIKTRRAGKASRSLRQSQALAGAYAEHVRERVQKFARPVNNAGRFIKFRYDSRELGVDNARRPFYVNSAYMRALGLDPGLSPFDSSKKFHEAARAPAGAFTVTGGMWKGLSVIDQKGVSSKIYFGGSSVGMRSKYTGKTKTGKKKTKKIRNRAKARTIRSQGLHVLQWTGRELDALLLALSEQMRLNAISRLGMDAGKWSGALIDRRLYRRASRYIQSAARYSMS